MLKKISLILLTSSIAFADCKKPVTYAPEGTPASCDGYHFTIEAERDNYKKLEKAKIDAQLVDLHKQESDILNERLKNYMEYSRDMENDMRKKEITSDIMKVVYFAAGVAVTYFGFKLAENQQ